MWKENWEETRQHFVDWWNRDGLIIGAWNAPSWDAVAHETLSEPPAPASIEESYTDADGRALRNHYTVSRQAFPLDVVPISETDLGPGSLSLFLGSEPGFAKDTVWYHPNIEEVDDLEELPPFTFDPCNRWWQLTEATLRACVQRGRGKYLTGCPDLIENVDILSALRDPQTFMMDMIEYPEWVEKRVREINQVWFAAYQRIYDIIKDDGGGSVFGAFRLWGPGKTAKVQCDACAMFSPDMFRRFVVPSLAEQCQWLDYSMYHLDGTQAMCHLDALLEIEALDAIEWTPQSGIEQGGSPRWYDLYRKILDRGKSIQAINVKKEEIAPLLDAIGTKGVYIMTEFETAEDAVEIDKIVKKYR